MERKYHSYIKEWRKAKGWSQKELIARLQTLAGDSQVIAPDRVLNIPTTEASLSRIENGKQNFSMETLEALAEVLGADEPGHLLTRNPLKEGKVVSILDKLDEKQRAQAAAVLEAMFGNSA